MAAPKRPSVLRRLPLRVLAALVVLAALAPQLLLPRVERAASATLRTPVDVGWLELDPLAGGVSLRDVTLGEGGPLTVRRVSVHPDVARLLRGEIELERVEIDGLRGTVDQDEKGLPVLRGLPFPEPDAAATGPTVAVEEVVLTDIDLEAHPPQRLRRHPVAVHLEQLVARQVPTSAAGAAYQGDLQGSLDGVPLRASARLDETPAGWRVEAEVSLTGSPVGSEQLRLPPGLESLSATADGRASYLLDPEREQDRLSLDLTLNDVRLDGSEDTSLVARRVAVAGLEANLAAGEVNLGRVTISGPRIEAALTPDGLVYPGLVPGLVESGIATSAGDAGADAPGWKVTGGRIEATAGEITLRRGEEQVALGIGAFSWSGIASGRAGELGLTVRVADSGTIDVGGTLGIDPPSVDVRADLSSLPLGALAGLLDAPLRIARGTASGRIEIAGEPAQPRIALEMVASQVHTAPPAAELAEQVLAVDRLETRLTVAPGPAGAVEIASLALSYPYAMVQRTPRGVFPLDLLTGAGSSTRDAGVPGASAAEPRAPADSGLDAAAATRPIRITSLSVSQGRVDYVDQTTSPPYWTGLASTDVVAREVRLAPRDLGTLELSARQDELHPLRGSAQRTGEESWRGALAVEGVSLPTLNPYLAPVFGYEAQAGTLDLDVDAMLARGRLSATSALELADVGLRQTGLDVIQQQTGVPLTVALSLLKDVGGTVEVTVPVEVDTTTGRYELGSFVTQAIGRAVLGALSSPLRWLGMLFGTDGPPHALAIDPVPFAPGSASLDASGRSRLEQIARILASHAELDVVLKSQIAEGDRASVGGEGLAALAAERVEAVRSALGRGIGGHAILASRLLVAPWSPAPEGKLDAAPGVYVEVQSR
ncbi:MAG: DUF748 domain-containing protein [Thermodesulfobacteriota bacterium]